MFKSKYFSHTLSACKRDLKLLNNNKYTLPLRFNINIRNYTNNSNGFKLRRALIVTKLSRYMWEKYRLPGGYNGNNFDDKQFQEMLRERGSDVDALLHYHNLNKEFEKKIVKSFQELGVETQIVNKFTINRDAINWSDMIVPIGGDGTFLLAATRSAPYFSCGLETKMKNIPVVGFNSDPTRSEGRLMLSKEYTYNIKDAVKKILTGDFEWMHRTRIRITLLPSNDINATKPMYLDDSSPQQRLTNNLKNNLLIPKENKVPITDLDDIKATILHHPVTENSNDNINNQKMIQKTVLPYLALNEVFMGETLSARVSHLHIKLDEQNQINRTKCSGMCVTTGTGSTSWHTSINRLSEKNVADLLAIIRKKMSTVDFGELDEQFLSDEYNKLLLFDPSDLRLSYSIREQVCVGVWPNPQGFESRGFAKNLLVTSRCMDASLVIDGNISYAFNDGTSVLLEVHPEDQLLTIEMK